MSQLPLDEQSILDAYRAIKRHGFGRLAVEIHGGKASIQETTKIKEILTR